MLEIIIHGRGGQGAVTTAELIAIAAINQGKYAQAFPSFGPERRGAPVVAFSRIDERKINLRSKIYDPDVVIVLDPSLLSIIEPSKGLKDGGIVLINTAKTPVEIKKLFNLKVKVAAVDGNHIAMSEFGRPIVNTTMLGALLKISGMLTFDDVKGPILARFGPKI